MPQDPTQPPSSNYGPFTDALTGPLTPKTQQLTTNYAPSRAGAIALFANNFLTGLQAGRRTAFERSEKQKAEEQKDFYFKYDQIMNDPSVSAEAKTKARQLFYTTQGTQIKETAKNASKDVQNKDNPLLHLAKAVGVAMAGPSEDIKHKGFAEPIAQLTRIAREGQIDPNALGSKAAEGLTSAISDIENRPGVPNANTGQPAQSVPSGPTDKGSPDLSVVQRPATAQIPGLSLPPAPELRQEATAGNVAQSPQAQAAVAPLIAQNIDPRTAPATAEIYRTLPQTPKPSPFKQFNYSVPIKDASGNTVKDANGLPQYDTVLGVVGPDGIARVNGQPLPKDAILQTPTSIKVTSPSSGKNMQHTTVALPDGKETLALFDPSGKNPGYFSIETGKPLEGAQYKSPAGTGVLGTYRAQATSELIREGNQHPSAQDVEVRAGEILDQIRNSALQTQAQHRGVVSEQTGVGSGPGFTPPKVNPTTPPPGTPAETSPSRRTGPTNPPPVEKPSASSGLSSNEKRDVDTYVMNATGAQKATGNLQLRAQRGAQILMAKTGMNAVDLATAVADYQGTRKALDQAKQRAGAFESLQNTIKEHGKVLEDAEKAYGPGNIPLKNMTWQAWQSISGPHPELTQLKVSLNAIKREYGRLAIGGVQSKGMLPVAAIKAGDDVFRNDATLADIIAAVKQTQIEADTEQKAFTEQQDSLKEKMKANPLSKIYGTETGGSDKHTQPVKQTATVSGLTLTYPGPDGKTKTRTFATKEELDQVKAAIEAAGHKVQQ